MRNRLCTVAATLGLLVSSACAQEHATPRRELPPTSTDPFSDPFFKPTDPTLADTVAANDARKVAAPTGCACDHGFTTWMNGELLIGRTRGPSVVPVVTTGPPSAGALAGMPGQPTTLPLFGGQRVLNDWRSGLRVELGVWLDDEHHIAIGARFYTLFSTSEQFRAVPNGTNVINVPQVVPTGAGSLQVPAFVGFPGITTGRVEATAKSTFAGGDLNARFAIKRNDLFRVDVLGGYRQLHLDDELGVNFTVLPAGANALLGARLTGTDSVRTRDNFYGPQLGLCTTVGGDRFWVEGHAAGALGVTASELEFTRSRNAATSPAAVNPVALAALGLPATLLAPAQIPVTQTNMSDRIAYLGVVGEGGVRFNWRAAEHVRVTAGYSFLYWNNVRRAQEMFVPGPVLRPQAIDFTTHLFNVGLDLRY